MTRAVVFANGDYSDYACKRADIGEEDFLVCVDGGARHCLAAGLQPDLLIGDLDSVSADISKALQKAQIECVTFPPKKDASDLELTLEVLSDRSYTEVVLLGVSGGRSDHFLFNFQLAASRVWPFKLRLIDASVDAYLVTPESPLNMAVVPNQLFSVLPLVKHAKGVSVVGAMYPLHEADIPVGSTLGLSNEATESHLEVTINEGVVLAMMVHDHD